MDENVVIWIIAVVLFALLKIGAAFGKTPTKAKKSARKKTMNRRPSKLEKEIVKGVFAAPKKGKRPNPLGWHD